MIDTTGSRLEVYLLRARAQGVEILVIDTRISLDRNRLWLCLVIFGTQDDRHGRRQIVPRRGEEKTTEKDYIEASDTLNTKTQKREQELGQNRRFKKGTKKLDLSNMPRWYQKEERKKKVRQLPPPRITFAAAKRHTKETTPIGPGEEECGQGIQNPATRLLPSCMTGPGLRATSMQSASLQSTLASERARVVWGAVLHSDRNHLGAAGA